MLIGRGILTWDREERVSDRYGFVYLLEYGSSMAPSKCANLAWSQGDVGQRAILKAIVLETRQSTHHRGSVPWRISEHARHRRRDHSRRRAAHHPRGRGWSTHRVGSIR